MIRSTRTEFLLSCCVFLFFLAGCAPPATATPFIPPTPVSAAQPAEPAPLIAAATSTPRIIPLPTPVAEAPTVTLAPPTPAGDCTNSLKYVTDLTFPDGTLVTAGQTIEKQWRVENNGTCNWDSRYRMKLMTGYSALGAPEEVALYPARSGAQGTLSILFIAPFSPGLFQSAWQAYSPKGEPFGEPVYIMIVVQ
jgi:hypothetical protein